MKRRIAILGSTGSIGTQTLQVIKEFPDEFELVGITAFKNVAKLSEQVVDWQPKYVGIDNKEQAYEIKQLKKDVNIFYGENYITDFINQCECDIFVNAISGVSGLKASYGILDKGKHIALANKESIVSAGPILKELAHRKNVKVLPVDSEHSALWQCLQGEKKEEVEKLILTASGGPFLGYSLEQLQNIGPLQALKHPTWSMGSKISIDSATLMNKGLEVIEAAYLFDFPINKVGVVIHPQSIVHSLIELSDGALKAQLGLPDMRQPIQYALFEGERKHTSRKRLELSKVKDLQFYEPDYQTFPCLKLAYQAGKQGGIMPAVLNAANQVAVERFLLEGISFVQIPELISKVLSSYTNINVNSVDEIIYYQDEAKRKANDVKL